MPTHSPRLKMSDEEIEALAQSTGVRLKVPASEIRVMMDRHLAALSGKQRDFRHAEKPDDNQ